jgi:crossover junction endodeoxyribonuclease RusA
MTEAWIEILLPWPDKALSPNSRSLWGKIRAVTVARELARMETINAISLAPGSWKWFVDCQLSATLIFNPPSKRRQDLDGMISRTKPYLDGIFQALCIDDSLICEIVARRSAPVKGGSVTIEIKRLEER